MPYFTLDELQIASPCSASWSGMTGDDQSRFCGDCKKHVYNLSMLTRAEANELIREKEGKLCVRLYRRSDGTVLTSDCPKGLRAIRQQYLKTRVKFAAAVGSLVALLGVTANSCRMSTETLGMPVPVRSDSVHVDTTHR